jgi:hypothetical protein
LHSVDMNEHVVYQHLFASPCSVPSRLRETSSRGFIDPARIVCIDCKGRAILQCCATGGLHQFQQLNEYALWRCLHGRSRAHAGRGSAAAGKHRAQRHVSPAAMRRWRTRNNPTTRMELLGPRRQVDEHKIGVLPQSVEYDLRTVRRDVEGPVRRPEIER